MTTPTAPTAAETVARTLADHPDGITTRDLADAAGVSPSATSKALTAMETDGTATRTPGPANGNRRPADIWRPVTDAATDEAATDENPADDVAEGQTSAAVADVEMPTDAPADEAPTATPDEVPDTVAPAEVEEAAPVSGAPVSPRQPDLKVLIMAGVLGGHPDGVTADAAIGESGLSVTMGDIILAAMEVAGAARRLPTAEDGTELWVIGDGDLATVDPANAPTTTTCPTCGHVRKIRRPSSARRATATGTVRTTGETNTDGSAKLGKGELERMVEAFMRDLGPGHDVTPGTVGRELGGRSPGAVGNAMNKLTNPGVLMMTSAAPMKYALSPTAAAPSAEVAALMKATTAIDTDDVPEATTDADTTDHNEADAADTTDGDADTDADAAEVVGTSDSDTDTAEAVSTADADATDEAATYADAA